MAGVLYKILDGGRQPASLTPVQTKISILGSDEAITIPCVTSTKVIEIKEMIAQRLGVDPGEMRVITRQGCSVRQQYDHEEIRRKVIILGISSFTRQKVRYEDPMVIIGAGHIGLRHGLWFLKHKLTNFVIYDRRDKVGGSSWIAQANKASKLQTELGTYHLQWDEDYPVPTNMPTWPSRDELLQHFHEVTVEYGLMPYIRFHTNVKQMEWLVREKEPGPLRLHIEKTDGRYEGILPPEPTGEGIEEVLAAACFMYPGNLIHARKEMFKGEDQFGGPIVYAMYDAFDYSEVTGKDAIIVGHGAFAVENVRTCCEYACRKVYMVCRRTNLACSRVVSWLVNQSSQPIPAWMFLKASEAQYKLTSLDPWSYYSVNSNAARTAVTIQQKARFGIGDVYFLAIYMGRLEVIIDKVKRLAPGSMHLESGRRLEASVILKLLGFTGDFDVDRLLKIKEMNGLWANGDNRRYIASEFPGVFANNFGGTSLSPGAITWVEQATHFMEYPKDWNSIMAADALPVNRANREQDRPAYVIDARVGMSISMIVPAFCPQIAERSMTVYSWLKHKKQLECHPMKKYLEEATAEWDEYAKKWKAEDQSLKDPPPYPYTPKSVQALLDEVDEFYKAKGGAFAAMGTH